LAKRKTRSYWEAVSDSAEQANELQALEEIEANIPTPKE